jgi:hypothetical protein
MHGSSHIIKAIIYSGEMSIDCICAGSLDNLIIGIELFLYIYESTFKGVCIQNYVGSSIEWKT